VLLDQPYEGTVVLQLGETIANRDRDSSGFRQELDDAVAAYKLMSPSDPADSAICRLVVALTNTSMQSLGRATQADVLRYQETYLRLGTKGALAVAELIELLDARRGGKNPSVSVGQVNVQSGGQAIVGHVGHPKAKPNSANDEDDDVE